MGFELVRGKGVPDLRRTQKHTVEPWKKAWYAILEEKEPSALHFQVKLSSLSALCGMATIASQNLKNSTTASTDSSPEMSRTQEDPLFHCLPPHNHRSHHGKHDQRNLRDI
jgi:hypothetical protein